MRGSMSVPCKVIVCTIICNPSFNQKKSSSQSKVIVKYINNQKRPMRHNEILDIDR